MNLNNYLIAALLDHTTNTTIWTPPTTLYVALLSDAATASDDTTTHAAKEVETPGANGYARQAIPFGAASGGESLNNAIVTFGPATADWDEATDAWLVDALTGGNILGQGTLVDPKTANNTDTLEYPVGAFKFRLA